MHIDSPVSGRKLRHFRRELYYESRQWKYMAAITFWWSHGYENITHQSLST